VTLVAAALLAAWVLALAVKVEPSQAAFPGHNGKIAFQSHRDGNYEIYTMNADGTNQTSISNNAADDELPAWSPDGNKIAFASNRDGNYDIYVMNSDGSDQINISNSGFGVLDQMAAWSPDGTKIAFQRLTGSNREIYTMNPDGTNQTDISNNSVHDEDPNWAPDGTKIAFWRDDFNVYVMNADGSNVTRITPELGTEPAWSPDGTKIAFTFASDINTINADGSAQTPLTSGGEANQFSDWQPTTAAPNTAPTITDVRPVPGSTTTERTPTIAATVTDQQTNLAKSNLTLLVDDVTILRTAFSYNRSADRMRYTPEKKLSLGSHAVEVIAQDGSGLSTTERWGFKIAHP
jgi:Tol biopolymer transport system component